MSVEWDRKYRHPYFIRVGIFEIRIRPKQISESRNKSSDFTFDIKEKTTDI